MKLSELKVVVKEAVREAIQEEMKDILLEAVRSPKQVMASIPTPQMTPMPEDNRMAMRENIQSILGSMMPGANGTISANTNSMPLQMSGNIDTTSPNGSLPEGEVNMDQILGLMKSK